MCASSNKEKAGRLELATMLLFGVGWLLAMLTIPAVVWAQLLTVESDWMGRALWGAGGVSLACGLLCTILEGSRLLLSSRK